MIKRLLNRLSLTRITLILFITILPQSIWAEDNNYGLTIGDIPVTSENASNILGNGTQSSATYDADNYILTLNNVNLQSLNGIVWSEEHNLTIQFSGNNIINCRTGSELNADNGYCIYSTSSSYTLTFIAIDDNSTLTLTPPNGTSGNLRKAIGGFRSFSLSEGYEMYSTENYSPITEMSKLQEGIGAVVLKGQPTGLKIAGVYVTTKNMNNVTGNNIIATTEGGSISFEPAVISQEAGGTNTPATLTLNKATINGQIESTIEDLHVRLIGNNTITPSSAYDAPIEYTANISDITPQLTFESTESEAGELTLSGYVQESGSGGYKTLSIGGYSVQGEFDNGSGTNNTGDWQIDYPNNTYHIYFNVHYNLWVIYDGQEYQYTKANKTSIVYGPNYDPDNNALEISGTYYNTIISSMGNLNLKIRDANCHMPQIKFRSISGGATTGTLTIIKDTEDTNNKCGIEFNDQNGAIIGFSDVIPQSPLKLVTPKQAPSNWSTFSGNQVIISDMDYYDLWIGGQQVNSGNAANFAGTSDVPTISFDGDHTLTLNGADYGDELGDAIISNLPTLTIMIKGECRLYHGESGFAIKSQNADATLEFMTQDLNPGKLELGRTNAFTGFKDIEFSNSLAYVHKNVNGSEYDLYYIDKVDAPIIESAQNVNKGIDVSLSKPATAVYDNLFIHYYIDYADGTSTDIQEWENLSINMTKPGTLTAYISAKSDNKEYGKSVNAIGKYFGYKQNPAKVVFNGSDAVTFTPELEPAIESTDKISVSYTSGEVSINNNTATISAFGSYMITGQLNDNDLNDLTIILNPDTIKVNVQAVPATPTIVKEDRTYLSTEKISITSSAPSETTICYKWDEENEQTYNEPIAVKAGTLHAWVKYTDGASGGSVSVYSNPAEATFTVVPDISELTFTPSSIDNITYTGRAITPSVAITKNGETVSSDNYTVKTVQEIEGEQTVVEAINVGSYTLVIEGKNDYGGKKEIPFTISQADMASITIEPISDQTYTGEDLTPTLSVKLGEVTVASDEYTVNYTKNGATATEIKEAGTYTVTLTSTDKNFSTSTTKSATFTISAASASISAENQTATYTGSDIEFDKSKISVEPASLSSSITTTYYATNPDDSQANTPSPMGSAPKNIGQYWVVIGLSNANYQASQTVTLTILPPKPTITPEGGQQRYDTTITLAKPYDVPGADIYYSWNNGADSTIYEAPINVETGTLKAWMIVEYMGVDVAGGKYKGEIATAAFTRQEDPALSFIGQDNKTIETAEYTIGGSDQSLPTLKNTHNVTVSLESSNSQVATINDGVVTPVGVGTTTITASSPATEGYIASNVSYTLTVYKSLSHESISITVADATYNGEPQTPTITVKDGETTLTKAETSDGTGDYTVVYSNNTLAAASTDDVAPTATITGKGNYKGEVSRTFTISTATMTITAEGYNGTYDGNTHGITVTAPEGATVKYGTKKGTYDLDASPTYTDAGSYMVHYQVVKTNYATIADSAKVEITKATPSITFDEESYTATYGAEFTAPTASTNPEGLTVTATSSSNTQVAAVADGVITITGIGETTITVSFAGNNNYEAATTTYKLNVAAGAITGITATGYTGTYDGNAHGITVTAPEGASIKYGTKKGTYDLDASPTYTDAGSYMVHYQVERTNYATITDSAKVEITKATPSITFDKESYSATYGEAFTAPTASTNPEGLTVTATSSSNTQVATISDGVITIAGVGETTITASFAGSNNYEATTATYKLNVAAGTIIGVTATGYSDVYDGKAHGITVTAPEGATIKYGTKKGTYNLNQSPTYSDAGTYMVHYQVECTNYTTLIDSVKVEITKVNITPSITLEGWAYGTTANTPVVTGNTGNGVETFTYKAEGSEAFTSEVPTAVGTHTVKVTIAETTNYNGGEATTTFTITNRTIDPAKDITFAEGQSYASFYSADEDLVLPESGIAVYMITGIEGNTLITQAVSYIPKGVPVLIEKTETAVEAKDPSEVGTNMLQYATEDVAASGTLYILYNGEYVKATGTIPQGKCYLKLNKPSGARILTIGNNNGTTSISNFNADTETDRWFDLNGQRISKPQKKGLYIKNGKKIVVK